MREIKFRAWKHVNTPEMFNDVQAIDFKSGMAHLGYKLSSFTERTDKERLDNLILMQYTGLKDVDGVEVYEGDVVKITNNFQENEVDYNAQIIFKDGGFCAIDGTENNYGIRRYRLSDFGYELKVIGNIHQHPELLGDNQ